MREERRGGEGRGEEGRGEEDRGGQRTVLLHHPTLLLYSRVEYSRVQ